MAEKEVACLRAFRDVKTKVYVSLSQPGGACVATLSLLWTSLQTQADEIDSLTKGRDTTLFASRSREKSVDIKMELRVPDSRWTDGALLGWTKCQDDSAT